VSHRVPGVEWSTGSLGHGLPVGAGIALALQRGTAEQRTVVLLSDGELDEGSNWEAILFAGHHRLRTVFRVSGASPKYSSSSHCPTSSGVSDGRFAK
jgi:transketolase